jgi:ferrous iron transport protein A
MQQLKHGRHQHQYRYGQHRHLLTLDRLQPGKKGRIRVVGGERALRRRLLDMGLTPNTIVLVRKIAPLGDPIELCLRNFEMTIRKEDASHIGIEEVQD